MKAKLFVAGLATIGLVMLTTAAMNVRAGEREKGMMASKEVTMTGRVVDLHCYMTGKSATPDMAKCTADCIRAGVPAGLESEEGFILLGEGMQGPAKSLIPFAYQHVEISGKLFERDGLKYLDLTSVKPALHMEDHGTEEVND